MSENYRKPIASLNKFPQFTTMNVIDGQAGLASYSSLIFYSLTIDNILNIIVLLILAGISIAMLTGNNGILTQANNSKEMTTIAALKEELNLYKTSYYNQTIEADKENIYIDGVKKEGTIYNILTSLKNSGYDNSIVIKNGKIYIENENLLLNNQVKQYIYEHLEDFYLAEYGSADDWQIEVIDENQKTCKLTSIYVDGIENGFLRLPDYVRKDGIYYKVINNKKDILADEVEVTKLFIPETFETFNRLKTRGVTDEYLKEVYVADGLKTLEYGAFSFNSNLTTIRLPNTLKYIGGACFWDNKSLLKIKIPESVENIGGQAFIGSGIREIAIPKNVKQMGSQVFQNCRSLKSVIFLNELSTMPVGTFLNSTVETIQFPKNIIEIADKGMSSGKFEKIDLPNTIQKIGNNAFANNYELKEIRVPNSIKEIGENIFDTVPLNAVTIYTDNQTFIDYMNENYPGKATIKSYNEWT